MAGGKETPRQKMIGMMYMVLTALLALNVSSAIIEKFVIIDDTLVKLGQAADSSNNVLATAIQRGTSAGASVDTAKRKALQVRALTKQTLNFLDIVKKTMALQTPPTDPPRFLKEGEVYKGPDGKEVKNLEGEDYNLNSHRPEEFFLGDVAMKTVGAQFEGTLDQYVKQMNNYIGQVNATKPTTSDGRPFAVPSVKKLTRTITDFPEFEEEAKKESTHKKFLEFSFQNVPLPAAMAYISELQAEILENEKVTLGGLKTIASAAEYVVDQLVPMVRAESNTVIYGLYYEADMFLAGSPSAGAAPEMYAGPAKLEVGKMDVGSGVMINRGKVKIKATSNNFVDNVAKQSFLAKIIIPGRAKPAELPIDFKVLRPTAKIGTVSGLSLYKDCGNIIEVSIPGMTDLSILGLSLPADEGRVTRISPGKFQVVPSRNSCTLSVTLEGAQIQTEKARPQDVPPPGLVIKQGGREVENPTTGPLILEPEITDKVFTSDAYKDDNRLIVQSFSYQINGGSSTTVNSNNINLSSIGARKGDQIQFSKFVVVRKDFTGALKAVNSTKMSKGFRIQ